jgi:hypothetical protein
MVWLNVVATSKSSNKSAPESVFHIEPGAESTDGKKAKPSSAHFRRAASPAKPKIIRRPPAAMHLQPHCPQ